MKIRLLAILLAAPAFAAAPVVGSPAPDFTLTAQDGKPVGLKDYRGQWVVLYFYPKDFTGGCTVEAHGFQQNLQRFTDAHAVILGVSVDTADSHKSFCAKEGLNFKLLADPKGAVSAAYGSRMPVVGLSSRHTFLIKPDGTVAKAYLKVKPSKHPEEVLADLADAQKPKP